MVAIAHTRPLAICLVEPVGRHALVRVRARVRDRVRDRVRARVGARVRVRARVRVGVSRPSRPARSSAVAGSQSLTLLS